MYIILYIYMYWGAKTQSSSSRSHKIKLLMVKLSQSSHLQAHFRASDWFDPALLPDKKLEDWTGSGCFDWFSKSIWSTIIF